MCRPMRSHFYPRHRRPSHWELHDIKAYGEVLPHRFRALPRAFQEVLIHREGCGTLHLLQGDALLLDSLSA